MSEGEPSLARRLLPKLLLGAGVLLAAGILMPAWPRDQLLVFDVGEVGVERLDATLRAEDGSGAESGVTLNFPSASPARIPYRLSAPNGRYALELTLTRRTTAGPTVTTLSRRVTLSGDEIVVRLSEEP